MAIRFNAAGDRLTRTTDLLNYNAAYSVAFWVHNTSGGTNGMSVFCITNTASNYDLLQFSVDGTTLSLFTKINGTSSTGQSVGTVGVGAWAHVAYVRTSISAIDTYLNGVFVSTSSYSVTGRTAADEMAFSERPGLSNESFDGRVAGVKIWTAALTAAEIAQEMYTLRPVRFANLHLWSPCFPGATERLRDYGPSTRNWTAAGTLTDEDPPPVAWGAGALVIPVVSAVSVNVDANLQTLSLSQPAATAAGGANVAANLQTLTLDVLAPGVSGGSNFAPNLQTLTMTQLPAVASTDVDVPANIQGLTLTVFVPTITTGSNVTAAMQSLTLSPLSPTVEAGADHTTNLTILTVSALGVTVETGANVEAGLPVLVLSALQATASGAGDVEIIVDQAVLIASALVAQGTGGAIAEPGLPEATLTPLAPGITGGASVAANLQTAMLATLAPTASGGAVVTVGLPSLALGALAVAAAGEEVAEVYWALLAQGFYWLGNWNSSTTYQPYQVVHHGGVAYIAVLGNTNQEPPNAVYWDLFAGS